MRTLTASAYGLGVDVGTETLAYVGTETLAYVGTETLA